jgi:hypothetical protein
VETEKRELDDVIKNRDRINISFNNQIAALEKERTELRKSLDMRNSTIAY